MKIYLFILGAGILRNIQEVKNVESLREVPARELQLKVLRENDPPLAFEVKLY